MKKALFALLLCVTVLGFGFNVYAEEEVYYTNGNGVELNEKEYKFLTAFYWDGYPAIMTKKDYQNFIDTDMMNRRIIIKKSNGGSSKSPYHGTSNKAVQISAACYSTCLVSITANWFTNPNNRSYDDIGAYLSGPSYYSYSHTYVSSSAGTTYTSNIKTPGNGIGSTVKLPDSATNIIISLGFTTVGSGTIYGSYQHSVTPITLATAQNYNISFGGYGHVFDFYGTAAGVFDGMAGVDITV